MIHGDCSSRGCYAMTDEQISEIYAVGREAFFGGQRAFQVQAYPFRMTSANLARHRNNPHMPFWKMLKQGSDMFEVTRQEPKVDVCEKRYVFNAEQPANATRPLNFNPTAKCPAYQLDQDMVAAVQDKQRKDEQQIAQLVSRGTGAAPARTGVDGGMHPVFASKLPNAGSVVVAKDANYSLASYLPAPGTIPAHVNPPVAPAAPPTDAQASAALPRETPPLTATPETRPATAMRAPAAPFPAATGTARDARPELRGTSTQAAAPAKPASTTANAFDAPRKPADPAAAAPERKPAPAAAAPAIAGAQPIMPSSSFENRWSAFR
jgi:hypothetical protein